MCREDLLKNITLPFMIELVGKGNLPANKINV